MPTVSQNIALIRQRLGEPGPQTPSDAHLLNILIEHINNHCAQLQNTRNHWSVGHWQLGVSAGVEDYVVSAADFGRPFLVYSVDSADSFHVRREIPFTFLQDADQRYWGPQQTYSTYPWSAAGISFYRLSPSAPAWYARVTPIPGVSGIYEVFYEANYEFGSLGDSPGLSPFHHLIRVQTALSALPLCAWSDISITKDPKSWRLQHDTLRDVLLHDEAAYQAQFDAYKSQSTRDGVNNKIGYGYDYESGDDYGVGAMVNGWGW